MREASRTLSLPHPKERCLNMVVGKLTEHFSPRQRKVMAECRNKLATLYEGNGNSVTYTLTGLLSHLLALGDGAVWASSYVHEKVELLEGCVE